MKTIIDIEECVKDAKYIYEHIESDKIGKGVFGHLFFVLKNSIGRAKKMFVCEWYFFC